MKTLGGARGWFVTLFVAGAVLAAGTGPAQVQDPYAMVVAYEVTEEINCNPGGEPDLMGTCTLGQRAQGFGTRLADASILGGVAPYPGGATGIGAGYEFTGEITINAASVLSQVDWTGPAHGSFTLKRDDKVVTGRLSGQLDLSQAVAGVAPLAPIAGTWHGTKGTLKQNGTFSGAFVIPVPSELVGGCEEGTHCYLDFLNLDPSNPDSVAWVRVLDNERRADGTPLVKLIVFLYN